MKFVLRTSRRSLPFQNGLRAILVTFTLVIFGVAGVGAQAINEGFDDLPALLANDWHTFNNSSPKNPAVNGFVQCELGGAFTPQSGSPSSCVVGASSAGTGFPGIISTWLVGPTRTFANGEQISFYTRDISNFSRRNRMQVRLSTSGTSTDVGTTATGVGAFTTLLLDINPTYAATGQAGGYPEVWTKFTITISGLASPASGRFAFRFFVENDFNLGSSSLIGIDSLGYPSAYVATPTPTPTPSSPQHVLDFNGDGRTDYTLVRNTGGGPTGQLTWFVAHTDTATTQSLPWGIVGDSFVPADYDGDNKSDIAVWRGGPPFGSYFYILKSSTGTFEQIAFGQSGDDPSVTDDYTGDGKADPAVYRSGQQSGDPSYWYFRPSEGQYAGQPLGTQWGRNGDFPAPGDYNGDGKADFNVQRNAGSGQGAFIRRNGTGGSDAGGGPSSVIAFGTPTDLIAPGDYDGDGVTDLAVVRGQAGQYLWNILYSSTGATFQLNWGLSGTDFVSPGDYDGDGKTDLGVFRPNANAAQNYFYIRRSSGTPGAPFEWGQQGDYPVANYNVH